MNLLAEYNSISKHCRKNWTVKKQDSQKSDSVLKGYIYESKTDTLKKKMKKSR